MNAILPIGTSGQNLDGSALEFSNSQTKASTSSSQGSLKVCGEPQKAVSVITEQGEIEGLDGILLIYKKFTFPSQKIGDCEWKKESITVYSDGSYEDIYELKDHGSVFGDCFTTSNKVQNSAGHSFHEWKWQVKVNAGAKWNDRIKGKSEALKEAFNELTVVHSDRNCSWPNCP